MKPANAESKLRWIDAVLIFALIALLIVAFLFQLARQTDAFRSGAGEDNSVGLPDVTGPQEAPHE